MTSARMRAAKRLSSCALGPGVKAMVYWRLGVGGGVFFLFVWEKGVGGGGGGEGHGVLAVELGVGHFFSLGLEKRRGCGARGVYARPVAAVFFGELHEVGEINFAGHGQDHVAGAVAVFEIVGHLVAGEFHD